MTIPVQCSCGCVIVATSKVAGKQVTCPECGEPVEIRSGTEDVAVTLPRGKSDNSRLLRIVLILAIGAGVMFLACPIAIFSAKVLIPRIRDFFSEDLQELEPGMNSMEMPFRDDGATTGDFDAQLRKSQKYAQDAWSRSTSQDRASLLGWSFSVGTRSIR